MSLANEGYSAKKRTRNWLITGLVVGASFTVYKLITHPGRPLMPTAKALVDAGGKRYYKHLIPVSAHEQTYLMAASYEYGFNEPYKVFKIYYVWYRDSLHKPLRAVVYNKLENIKQVRFYRTDTTATTPITVVLSAKAGNTPARTWTFMPPKTFPTDLLESGIDTTGFRQYDEWYPSFEY